MAIAQTGAFYKALNFDGKSSRTYGVYITGEAVFNAPEREVEMISIPGRNGAFAMDRGRFENITVSYPAGIFAETEEDFADAISDFRNYLCSRSGYCRLTDDYNSDEYRLAVYKSGLEVDPALLRAGEFNIVFECKPQRFLTSGETAIAVSSGDTVTNPTLFASSPLLEVYGYGNIAIGDVSFEIAQKTYGRQAVTRSTSVIGFVTDTITIDDTLLEAGDPIVISGVKGSMIADGFLDVGWDAQSITTSNATATYSRQSKAVTFGLNVADATFTYGTSGTYQAYADYNFRYYYQGSVTYVTWRYAISFSYDGSDMITVTVSTTGATDAGSGPTTITSAVAVPVQYATSSKLVTNPAYIDLDIGEAYGIENGEVYFANDMAILPAELPTLAPGSNTITFDNTFTSLKVTPRWWKL